MRIFITIKNKIRVRKKTPAGFTIIEILLVAALIALLAGAASWVSMGMYKRLLVERTARDIFFAAKYARILAIEKQTPYSLLLNIKENFFCLISGKADSIDQQPKEPISNQYTKPHKLEGNVKFEHIKITPTFRIDTDQARSDQTIIFNPDGTADAAVVQIGNGKSHYTVYLSAGSAKPKVHLGPAEELRRDIIDLDELE